MAKKTKTTAEALNFKIPNFVWWLLFMVALILFLRWLWKNGNFKFGDTLFGQGEGGGGDSETEGTAGGGALSGVVGSGPMLSCDYSTPLTVSSQGDVVKELKNQLNWYKVSGDQIGVSQPYRYFTEAEVENPVFDSVLQAALISKGWDGFTPKTASQFESDYMSEYSWTGLNLYC